MPADPPRPARDEKHDETMASLLRLERSPSVFKTVETRRIVQDAHEWMRLIMCDLRGHEAALTQAERRAEKAERLAREALRVGVWSEAETEAMLAAYERAESHKGTRETLYAVVAAAFRSRASALTADAGEVGDPT